MTGSADDFLTSQIGDDATGNDASTYLDSQLAGDPTNYSVGNSVLMGLRVPLDAGAQMLAHALPDNVNQALTNAGQSIGLASSMPADMDSDISKRTAQYNADRSAAGKTGFDWPYTAGNVASAIPFVAATPELEGASMLAKGANLLGQGYAYGALSPVNGADQNNFWSQKNTQGEMGAGINGILGPISSAVSSAISPTVSDGVNTLINSGITPTLGQTLGGGFKSAEDKMTSIPVLGDMIKNAQNRAANDLNTAVANRALAPIGQQVTAPPGREMVQEVSDKLGNAYNELLPKLQFSPDLQFQNEITNTALNSQFLPPAQAAQFKNIVGPQLSKIQNGASGEDLQGALSELKSQAKGYQSDDSFDNRKLGQSIGSVVDSINDGLQRSNPVYAPQLQAINTGYANYAILRKAATNLGQSVEPGVFSPAQLQQAVRSSDQSVAKGNFARGNALMQDLSDSAIQTMGGKYPDSGTPGRELMALGLGGLAEGGGHLAGLNPFIPTALAASALPYTKLGQSAVSTLLTQRPDAAPYLAKAISSTSPYLSAGVIPSSPFMPFSLNGSSQ